MLCYLDRMRIINMHVHALKSIVSTDVLTYTNAQSLIQCEIHADALHFAIYLATQWASW